MVDSSGKTRTGWRTTAAESQSAAGRLGRQLPNPDMTKEAEAKLLGIYELVGLIPELRKALRGDLD